MITEKWKEDKLRNKISNLKELLYVYNSTSLNKDEVKLIKSLIKYAGITFNLYYNINNQTLNNILLNLESFDIFENFDKYNDNNNIYEINLWIISQIY
jgi:hypothetical protein